MVQTKSHIVHECRGNKLRDVAYKDHFADDIAVRWLEGRNNDGNITREIIIVAPWPQLLLGTPESCGFLKILYASFHLSCKSVTAL